MPDVDKEGLRLAETLAENPELNGVFGEERAAVWSNPHLGSDPEEISIMDIRGRDVSRDTGEATLHSQEITTLHVDEISSDKIEVVEGRKTRADV